jgi:hypothetical protein
LGLVSATLAGAARRAEARAPSWPVLRLFAGFRTLIAVEPTVFIGVVFVDELERFPPGRAARRAVAEAPRAAAAQVIRWLGGRDRGRGEVQEK